MKTIYSTSFRFSLECCFILTSFSIVRTRANMLSGEEVGQNHTSLSNLTACRKILPNWQVLNTLFLDYFVVFELSHHPKSGRSVYIVDILPSKLWLPWSESQDMLVVWHMLDCLTSTHRDEDGKNLWLHRMIDAITVCYLLLWPAYFDCCFDLNAVGLSVNLDMPLLWPCSMSGRSTTNISKQASMNTFDKLFWTLFSTFGIQWTYYVII